MTRNLAQDPEVRSGLSGVRQTALGGIRGLTQEQADAALLATIRRAVVADLQGEPVLRFEEANVAANDLGRADFSDAWFAAYDGNLQSQASAAVAAARAEGYSKGWTDAMNQVHPPEESR